MPRLYYKLTDISDPEDRLEDAAMWKALRDFYGRGIEAHENGVCFDDGDRVFGRIGSAYERLAVGRNQIEYWNDRGFRSACSRRMEIADIKGAAAVVEEIHAAGRNAFLKATKQKQMATPVWLGQSIFEALDAMVYSFTESPDCLLVQDYVPMRNEHRFIVIAGGIVTHSPVAEHLTPLSRGTALDHHAIPIEQIHFETPRSRNGRTRANLTNRMIEVATQIIETSGQKDMVLDLAEIENGRIEPIGISPMQIGRFHLYACDPIRIARASVHLLDSELRADVLHRRDQIEIFEPDEIPAPQG